MHIETALPVRPPPKMDIDSTLPLPIAPRTMHSTLPQYPPVDFAYSTTLKDAVGKLGKQLLFIPQMNGNTSTSMPGSATISFNLPVLHLTVQNFPFGSQRHSYKLSNPPNRGSKKQSGLLSLLQKSAGKDVPITVTYAFGSREFAEATRLFPYVKGKPANPATSKRSQGPSDHRRYSKTPVNQKDPISVTVPVTIRILVGDVMYSTSDEVEVSAASGEDREHNSEWVRV